MQMLEFPERLFKRKIYKFLSVSRMTLFYRFHDVDEFYFKLVLQLKLIS